MKIVIVGSGRLGTGLANEFEGSGEKVTVVSSNIEEIKRLKQTYSGPILCGKEFDKEILEKAGISSADGLIACTQSDETNALVARIARINYKVPKVIARLYDSRKVSIYNALGVQVIATTQWGVARAKELLTFNHVETVMSIGNTPVELVRINVPQLLIGKRIKDALPLNEIRICALSRGNESFIPTSVSLLQANDILYFTVLADSIDRITRILDL